MRVSVLSILASLSFGLSKVIEADDKTIQEVIDSGIPTLLSLYAPWCGHCKTFHPQFDELAASFEHAGKQIQFVRLDGDSNRKTAKKYDVKYYPTLKFVQGDKVEDINNRQIPALEDLIKQKTGAIPKDPQDPKVDKRDFVVPLTDTDFDKNIEGKDSLVAFTTTWCTHCKELKPLWSQLAALYAKEDNIVIGRVDCTEGAGKHLSKKYNVQAYPTILYFPKDGSKPDVYTDSRTLQGFTEYFKEKGASMRDSTGFLSITAGIIEEFADESSKYIDATEKEAAAFLKKVESSSSQFTSYYLKLMPKIREGGVKYIKKERKRLQKLIKSNVSYETRDSIRIRMNILRSFIPGAGDSKSEL